MGVSLRDIAQQFSREGMAAEEIIDRMKEKRDEAQQLSRHYAALGEDIDELIRFSEAGLHREGVVDIRPAEDMLIFRSQEGGIIPRNKKDQEHARRWLEAQPAVSVSVVADPASGKSDFALAIDKKRAQDFGIEAKGSCVWEIKGGMALHATVACEEEYYQSPGDMFKPVEQFAREHRFAPKGMLCGRILFVDCAGGRQRHYYDTYMVFE